MVAFIDQSDVAAFSAPQNETRAARNKRETVRPKARIKTSRLTFVDTKGLAIRPTKSQANPPIFLDTELLSMSSNETEISHGRVSWQIH
jgi:hypothetical protein